MEAAASLKAAAGKSIVLSGTNDLAISNSIAINQELGNYGSTLDLENPSLAYCGDDAATAQLVADMNAGEVSTLITLECNPSYDLPNAEEFNSGLAKVKLQLAWRHL